MNHLTLISLFLMFYLTTFTASLPLDNSKHLYLSENELSSPATALEAAPMSPSSSSSIYFPLNHRHPLAKRSDFFDTKRSGARGFHEGIFDQGFGAFSPLRKRGMKKRRPEMTSRGIHSDAFTNGFGDFYTMKRSSGSLLADDDDDLEPSLNEARALRDNKLIGLLMDQNPNEEAILRRL